MARLNFKNGDIVQIPLPNNLGFAYAKCIDLYKQNPKTRYPVLIRVYNLRSTSPMSDPQRFGNMDLILSPLLIAGINPIISEGVWKVVSNIPISGSDTFIPHYKKAEPDEESAREWYYIINADISKKVKTQYENVKHLESIGAIGSELVGTKISMALIHDEGKVIKDYFSLEEYFEKKFFNDVMTIPAYYKLPEQMRGRALNAMVS